MLGRSQFPAGPALAWTVSGPAIDDRAGFFSYFSTTDRTACPADGSAARCRAEGLSIEPMNRSQCSRRVWPRSLKIQVEAFAAWKCRSGSGCAVIASECTERCAECSKMFPRCVNDRAKVSWNRRECVKVRRFRFERVGADVASGRLTACRLSWRAGSVGDGTAVAVFAARAMILLEATRASAGRVGGHARKIAPIFFPRIALAPRIVTARKTIAHTPSALARNLPVPINWKRSKIVFVMG